MLKHSGDVLHRASALFNLDGNSDAAPHASTSTSSFASQENLPANLRDQLPQRPAKALLAHPRPELPLPHAVEPAVPDRKTLKVDVRAGNEDTDYRGVEDDRLIYAVASREFARSPMPPAGLASVGADIGDAQPAEPEEPPKPLTRWEKLQVQVARQFCCVGRVKAKKE